MRFNVGKMKFHGRESVNEQGDKKAEEINSRLAAPL